MANLGTGLGGGSCVGLWGDSESLGSGGRWRLVKIQPDGWWERWMWRNFCRHNFGGRCHAPAEEAEIFRSGGWLELGSFSSDWRKSWS
jgi:hypothetical protein